jgi:hypothetical protein
VVYSRSGSGERRYLLEEIRQKIGAKEVVLIGHSEQEMPTLVIKGRCDYLSWSSAQEYWGHCPTTGSSPGRLRAQSDPRLAYTDFEADHPDVATGRVR